MNCDICRERLSPYIEGELEEAQQKEVSDHLAACTACSAQRTALQEMLAQLKALPEQPVPSGFRQAVWQKIEAPRWPARARRRFPEPWILKLPLVELAAVAVALLVVQVTRVTGPQVTKPQAESDIKIVREELQREQTPLETLPVTTTMPASDRVDQKRANRKVADQMVVAQAPPAPTQPAADKHFEQEKKVGHLQEPELADRSRAASGEGTSAETSTETSKIFYDYDQTKPMVAAKHAPMQTPAPSDEPSRLKEQSKATAIPPEAQKAPESVPLKREEPSEQRERFYVEEGWIAAPQLHIQLWVKDVTQAGQGIGEILSDLHVLKAEQPTSTQYYLVWNHDQLAAFVFRLLEVCEAEKVQIVGQLPANFPSAQEVASISKVQVSDLRCVVLDVVTIEPSSS